MSKRIAVYARVSTTRQADHDVSIPDQLSQAHRYCDGRGWPLVQEFVDAGASARDDKRPELQRMMDLACQEPSPFDVVLVHSQSRFFRDSVGYGLYKRKLEKHGVLLISMTQDFGAGPSAEFAESVIAAADAWSSAENAKHTSRTMIENARQGFWNGAMPPFGYRTVEAERRGQKIKKRLEIDEREAAIVRKIFELFLQGDGIKGPMGIKEITSWLNRNGLCNKRGKQFFMSCVHRILTRETYTGLHHYNRVNSRLQKSRPRDEWIAIQVPQIIPPEEFHRVQALLHIRRPNVTAPRITSSEVLLTGLARCESCGSPLMLITGKNGRYRYYGCSAKRLKGGQTCTAPVSIPEAELDQIVLTGITDRLLTPDRLTALLREAHKRRRELASKSSNTRSTLKSELRGVESQIQRLIAAVAEGAIPDMAAVRPKLDELHARRDETNRHLALLDQDLPALRQGFSNQQAATAAKNLQNRLLNAPKGLQRRYVRGLVTEIITGRNRVEIAGPNAAIANCASDPACLGSVLGSVREWRALGESNPSCKIENLES